MKRSIESVINVLAERVSDRTHDDRRDQLQRRNQVVDIYGAEFQRQGDAGSPADFYISISPDLVFIERFEFKIIIQPFAMPVGNSGSTGFAGVTINPTTLTIENGIIRNPAGDITQIDSTITPNPHTHTTQGHNHPLAAGITQFTSNVDNFRIEVAGIDLTSYLQAQHPTGWVTGEGIFPSNGLVNFDLIDINGYLPPWQQGILMQSGYKNVRLYADGAFNATIVLYLKLSHCNR